MAKMNIQTTDGMAMSKFKQSINTAVEEYVKEAFKEMSKKSYGTHTITLNPPKVEPATSETCTISIKLGDTFCGLNDSFCGVLKITHNPKLSSTASNMFVYNYTRPIFFSTKLNEFYSLDGTAHLSDGISIYTYGNTNTSILNVYIKNIYFDNNDSSLKIDILFNHPTSYSTYKNVYITEDTFTVNYHVW